MSVPIPSFNKLSLRHKMEAPRGYERGLSGDKGKGRALSEDEKNSDTSSEDEYESDDDENEGSTFDPSETHVLALDHCRQYGSRYAFQIADAEVRRCSIRIDDSANGLTCSCDREGSCRHKQWLLTHLAQARQSTTLEVSPPPHALISSLGLKTVCEKLDWDLRDGPESDSEETKWKIRKDYSVKEPGHQPRQVLQERMQVVRDILAALSNSPTDDFRNDIFESPDNFTEGRIFIPRDLEATVSRLLIHDDDVFGRFRNLVKSDVRASDYFRKMGMKAQNTCALLDRYCDGGPAEAGGKFDLIWCAQTLTDIVQLISVNVVERQPLSPSSREDAAKALILILRMIVKERNHDVYQNLKWPRRRIHGEPQIDRNLYLRLIGSTAKANPAGGNFVIEALQDLPEARRFVDDLEDIYSLLDTVGWSAPKAYLEKLSNLIARLKGGSGPSPSSSSGKRSAAAIERAAKRMK